jgi:transcriptional regulator with XRE-family HTH domain
MADAPLKIRGGPNVVDVHVGGRIRLRRRLLGITQEQLAHTLGLTFQQVQKYERGTNRVSASKLYETARILSAPVAYFFEGLEGGAAEIAKDEAGGTERAFFATTEGLELARVFPRVPRGALRRRVLELVRALAESSVG